MQTDGISLIRQKVIFYNKPTRAKQTIRTQPIIKLQQWPPLWKYVGGDNSPKRIPGDIVWFIVPDKSF